MLRSVRGRSIGEDDANAMPVMNQKRNDGTGMTMRYGERNNPQKGATLRAYASSEKTQLKFSNPL